MKIICLDCISPAPLKRLVNSEGNIGKCDYCDNLRASISTDCLFDYIYERVRENIATEADLSDFELGLVYELGSDEIGANNIDMVFMDWFDLGEEPYFDDLCDAAPVEFRLISGKEVVFYTDDGELEKNIYEDRWMEFMEEISHVHRFFNENASKFLDAIFKFLIDDKNEIKNECIRNFPVGESLYRARNFADYKTAREIIENPASQLGLTPRIKASNQRMTPAGISALYCALDRGTCLSEIRSITGDFVISVALTPLTDLSLLDLTRIDQIEPPKLTRLDNGYSNAMHLKTFISSLVKKMSKPKSRNDDLSYLATQFAFEYLRLRFKENVDGLLIPSVQTGELGTNVVLFPESSQISVRSYDNSSNIAANDALSDIEAGAKLAVVANSFLYHKVVAIETKSREYNFVEELFMTDTARNRLGGIYDEPEIKTY